MSYSSSFMSRLSELKKNLQDFGKRITTEQYLNEKYPHFSKDLQDKCEEKNKGFKFLKYNNGSIIIQGDFKKFEEYINCLEITLYFENGKNENPSSQKQSSLNYSNDGDD